MTEQADMQCSRDSETHAEIPTDRQRHIDRPTEDR